MHFLRKPLVWKKNIIHQKTGLLFHLLTFEILLKHIHSMSKDVPIVLIPGQTA